MYKFPGRRTPRYKSPERKAPDVRPLDVSALRLATSRAPFLAAKRTTASDEVASRPAPYEIRRRTFFKG